MSQPRCQFVSLVEPDDSTLCGDVFEGILRKFGTNHGSWQEVSIRGRSPFHRVVILVTEAVGIIDNGGFEYLFEHRYAGDPNFLKIVRAFERIGFHAGARALSEALALFPGGRPPRSFNRRLEEYPSVPKFKREALNDAWFAVSNSAWPMLAEFIRKHRRHFEGLPTDWPKPRRK